MESDSESSEGSLMARILDNTPPPNMGVSEAERQEHITLLREIFRLKRKAKRKERKIAHLEGQIEEVQRTKKVMEQMLNDARRFGQYMEDLYTTDEFILQEPYFSSSQEGANPDKTPVRNPIPEVVEPDIIREDATPQMTTESTTVTDVLPRDADATRCSTSSQTSRPHHYNLRERISRRPVCYCCRNRMFRG